jgi:putative RecB family exonuclease
MDKQNINYSKIYSPSKLDMFEKCPKSYHFYYLDPIYSKMKTDLKKMPENIFGFNTLGRAVHNAITLFFHAPEDDRTWENLKNTLKGTWTSEFQWNKKPPLGEWGGFKTLEEEKQTYNQALLMLKNFFEIQPKSLKIEYLPTPDLRHSIQDYQNLIRSLTEDFDISGKFDLIAQNEDETLHIIDFKTGKKEDNNSFQLKFYKVLAEENFKKPVSKASFFFLKSGNIKEFDLNNQTKENLKDEIVEKINLINQTKEFETKPSKLCKFCLFKNFCPAKEQVKEFIKDFKEEDYADDLPF